jgi:long-chain fatty acid transport protein
MSSILQTSDRHSLPIWCTPYLTVVLLLFSVVPQAIGGGFLLQQLGACGTGMGDVGIASPGDPLLVQRNPASLALTSGTELSLGTTVIMPDTRFTPVGMAEIKMNSQVLFPPEVTLTHSFASGLSLGISASTPFAFRSGWDDEWVGARATVGADLRIVIFSAGAAYRFSPPFSAGVSINLAFPRMQYSRRLPLVPAGSTDALQSADGAGPTSIGFSLGMRYQPWKQLSLGLTYISRMAIHINDAPIQYQDIPDSLLSIPLPAKLTAKFSTPDIIGAGVSLRPFAWLHFEVDGQYSFWSILKTVDVRYEDAAVEGSQMAPMTIPYYWRNSWTINAGAQVEIAGVFFRGGYVYDQTPVQDSELRPALPDADRRGFSGGIGYWVSEGLRLDFAYEYLKFNDRQVGATVLNSVTVAPAGLYKTSWNVIGFNVNYFWE